MIDGIAGPATSRAIRLYESQPGLRVTGQPGKAMLDHIESTGRAARLLARIDAAKQRHIAQAREAAQATGSDQDRMRALCTLAVVSRDLGDRDGADRPIKAALDIGATMDNSFAGATAFARLAATLIDLTGAEPAAR